MSTNSSLFDTYARNLEAVKAHPRVRIEPDIDDVVVCPQCFKIISRDELLVANSQFSLEHVPPEALGGEVSTFACRDCNSWAGHELDAHLLNQLNLVDFIQGTPGAEVDARITLNDETSMNAQLVFTEEGILQIAGDPARSDPDAVRTVDTILQAGAPEIHISTRGRRGRGFRPRRPEAALLRIAYLYAFSVFGYSFLVNPGAQAVRSQFKSPEEEVLPAWGISQNQSIPDEALGINVVRNPPELRSFLVAFDLASSSSSRRYSVLLPGPTQPGNGIYQYMASQNQESLRVDMQLTNVAATQTHMIGSDHPFAFHEIWRALT